MLAHPTPSSTVSNDAWQHCVETDDVDVLAASQPEWGLRYDQLSTGAFRGLVRQAQLPGLRLVLEHTNQAMRQRGYLGHGNYGFAMALDPQQEVFFNGQRLSRNAIMLGRGEDLDLCTPAQFGMIGIVVHADLLNPLWERMYQKPMAAWLEQQMVVPAAPAMAQAVRELHMATLDAVSTQQMPGPAALLQLRDALLMEWIEAIPPDAGSMDLKSVAARKRVVDRACEIMLSHTREPLTILQLCSQVGASRRKLNYCFNDVLGTNPVKYLRAVRLNGVRRDLKAEADLSVNDAAARWGFWHMSQFSLDYKRQFGELPSATANTRRQRGGLQMSAA